MTAGSTMRVAIMLALCLGACAGLDGAGGDDAACTVGISFNPSDAVVGDVVFVAANVMGDGIATYTWHLTKASTDVPFEDANAQGSSIKFIATAAGVYHASLDVGLPGASCLSKDVDINVTDGSGINLQARLHVTPPLGVTAPPIDRALIIPAGADRALGSVVLDAGRHTSGIITNASGLGLPAYLTFMPDGAHDAVVEIYTTSTGGYGGQVLDQRHTLLVVPSDATLPPHSFAIATPSDTGNFTIGAGLAVSGTVVGPNGVGLVGAKVQIVGDGVPSTTATTGTNGVFTLRTQSPSRASTTVTVTPPLASGLPRLEATGAFTPASGITVTYNTALATRDVAEVRVTRGGAVPNAKVTIVGTIPAPDAGSISSGVAVQAFGYVRVSLTANASGELPSARVPAAALKAVVSASAGEYSVADFATSSAVPATIASVPMGDEVVVVAHGAPLPTAQVELIPSGALALAGVPSSVAVADATGTIHAPFASGGTYNAVFSDPGLRAGAQRIADATALPATIELPPAIRVTGTLSVQAGTIIKGASVELRCKTCVGIDRLRPLAEAVSDLDGVFTLAVTDPGSM